MVKISDKYGYLAKNTVLLTISNFASRILVFLLVPLYTYILSTSDYGIADTITTTAVLLTYVFTLNIPDAVLRFAIDYRGNSDQCLAFGLRVLNGGSAVLGVILVVVGVFNPFHWKGYVYFFFFIQFFFSALYSIYNYYLRAIDKVKEVAIAGIITTLVTILCNIVLLLVVKIGLVGYLTSMVAGSAAAAVYCLIKIGKSPAMPYKIAIDKAVRKAMLAFSIPLIFNGIAWWINNSIDKYFVIGMLGQSQNGILGVSYKIPTIMTVFHSIFFQAWNLSAIKEFDPEDNDGFFSKTYTLYNACLILACSGLILMNIPMARILFKKDFFAAGRYSSVLLLSNVFSALAGFVGSVFTAAKDSRIFAVSTVSTAVVNCLLNWIMIPVWGVMGAVIATCVSFCLIWLIRLVCSRRYIRWHINLLRDTAAYILLIAQLFAEHTEHHAYIMQGIIAAGLILLYRKEFMSIVKTITGKINQLVSRGNKTTRKES